MTTFENFCYENHINASKFRRFILFRYLYTPIAFMNFENLLEQAWKQYLGEYLLTKYRMIIREELK